MVNRRVLMVGASLFALSSTLAFAQAKNAAEVAVEAAKKYAGTEISIVWEAGLQSLDPLNYSGPKWEKLTGIKVKVVEVPTDQMFTKIMTLADRIILLRDGKIEQQGSPLDLFEKPTTGFVAGFIGSPSINLIPAKLIRSGKTLALMLGSGEVLELPDDRAALVTAESGRNIVFGIRPQHLTRAGGGALPAGHGQ